MLFWIIRCKVCSAPSRSLQRTNALIKLVYEWTSTRRSFRTACSNLLRAKVSCFFCANSARSLFNSLSLTFLSSLLRGAAGTSLTSPSSSSSSPSPSPSPLTFRFPRVTSSEVVLAPPPPVRSASSFFSLPSFWISLFLIRLLASSPAALMSSSLLPFSAIEAFTASILFIATVQWGTLKLEVAFGDD